MEHLWSCQGGRGMAYVHSSSVGAKNDFLNSPQTKGLGEIHSINESKCSFVLDHFWLGAPNFTVKLAVPSLRSIKLILTLDTSTG